MRTIRFYTLKEEDFTERFLVELPAGSTPLRVTDISEVQYSPFLWYETPDTEAPNHLWSFGLFRSTHPMPDDPMHYIDTFVYEGEVWHLYEYR